MDKIFEQKRLGEILTEAEIINKTQLEKALELQRRRNRKLGQILISLGYTDEEIVLSLLGKKLNSSYLKLSEYGKIEPEIIRSVPEGIARQNLLIPVERDADTLSVAMSDPQNTFVKDILRLITGFNIKSYISSEKEIKSAIDEHYKNLKISGAKCLPLNELGFDSSSLALYKKYIEMPSGLILIAGPSNSGKSTTLYSTLNAINFPDKNIVCFEETIECIIDGVNQVEIKPERGFNFSSGLCSCLKSLDADAIVVGEIRDVQTARLAIDAADAGYLVLCVINTDELLTEDKKHRKDDIFIVKKIIDFFINIVGIEPYLVASTLRMIVNQKLMKAICSHCKQVYMPSVDLMESIGIKIANNLRLYKGQGCEFCNYTGFEGFTGCFEVFAMSDKIRDLIIEGFSSKTLKKAVQDTGMITFQKAGINKVLKGETTIDEMLRVIDITEPQELSNATSEFKEMNETEFYWNIFEKTGSIGAFLLSKGKKPPENTRFSKTVRKKTKRIKMSKNKKKRNTKSKKS